MLNDVEWAEDGVYTPQGEHTPHEFFSNALSNSLMFDIQLGYFNSAAINVLSSSFATFISNGGFMRMAINQIVSAKDKVAISSGLEGGLDAPFDLTSWESIKAGLDEYGEHFFKCLAYLIQEKRIEIQIIKPKATSGIAHTKKGQFIDSDGMVVGFSGSANFTLGGLFNNLEDINIFLSTSPDRSIQKKIKNQKTEFDKVMDGTQGEIEYLSSKDLEAAITSSYGNQDIEDLLNVEDKLRTYKRKEKEANLLKDGGQGVYYSTPRFPYKEGPREYQKAAFENWRNNNQKGLFAMATGTGKTITSLNCLYEIYDRKGYYKAIILVPTVTLVNQWVTGVALAAPENATHAQVWICGYSNRLGECSVDNLFLYEGNILKSIVYEKFIPPVQKEAVESKIVAPKDGKLIYTPYNEEGDVIGDFSYAGFNAGDYLLPESKNLPVAVTISPLGDGKDDADNIQAAIDKAVEIIMNKING